MKLYFSVLKASFLAQIAYPWEIVSFIIRRFIEFGLMLAFWLVISKGNPELFEFRYIASYFLISSSITELTFSGDTRFGREIQKLISRGQLSNYLIKPVNMLRFIFASFAGTRVSVWCFSLISLIFGILIKPPISIYGILLFPVALILTTLAGYSVNILIACVGFYSPEAGSVRNVYEHIRRILSGALIPLSYFPPAIKSFALASPFPVLLYIPTQILQNGDLNFETFSYLGLSIFWTIVLMFFSNLVWKHSLKIYDGVGI